MTATKLSDIRHNKQEVDADGQTLGRFATKVALLLVGKNKPYFTRHLDCGDFVTVANASKIKVTGKKLALKRYTRYSGYPAGLHSASMGKIMETNPERILYNAIAGMLPNNKLKSLWLNRLTVKP